MQTSVTALHPKSTRRWPRYQIDLPIRIVAVNGILMNPITARGTDISRAGMALDARISLNPGDLMQVQFPTEEPSRVNAIVRHRNGSHFGLEFLGQLPPDDETKHQLKALPETLSTDSAKTKKKDCGSYTPRELYEGLRRKQEALWKLQKEIDALKMAIRLLAENEKEIGGLSIPQRLQLEQRPWPQA